MIEGKNSINDLIQKYSKANKESILTLLHRIDKLYSARTEVKKILKLIFVVNDRVDLKNNLLRLKMLIN